MTEQQSFEQFVAERKLTQQEQTPEHNERIRQLAVFKAVSNTPRI